MKRPTILTSLTALLVLAGAAHAAEPDADVMLLPAELDLLEQVAGDSVRASFWIVNTGAKPLQVEAVKGSCGCTTVDFTPQAIGPLSALEVPLAIRVPKRDGITKHVDVRVTLDGRPPAKLPVRIETSGTRPPTTVITADPVAVNLGEVTAGTTVPASVHLVNVGPLTRSVDAIKAACACTRIIDFESVTLDPGDTTDVQLEIDVPNTVGRPVIKEVSVFAERQTPLKVPVRMDVRHPLVDAVHDQASTLLGGAYELNDFTIDDHDLSAIAWTAEHRPAGRVHLRVDGDSRVEVVDFTEFKPSVTGG